MKDWGHTDSSIGLVAGRVSTGFIQATPGDMKSFRSSAERIALMVTVANTHAPVRQRDL
jgi:hypothetical protein